MNEPRELIIIECVHCNDEFETLINTSTGDIEDYLCPECRGLNYEIKL